MKPLRIVVIAVVSAFMLFVCIKSCCAHQAVYANDFSDYSSCSVEMESEENHSDWPDSIFEVVRNCSYLSDLEREVVIELNKCRSNPSRYADEVLVPFLERMGDDGKYVDSNGRNIITKEGRSAIQEAINALKSQKPLPMLLPNQDLSLAAADHCADQGPKGLTGHDSSDGSSMADRVMRRNSGLSYIGIGENISYGENKGFDIIRQLIVDDGVPSRGHRENTFRDYYYVGVAFGTHKKYRYMCVLDFSDYYSGSVESVEMESEENHSDWPDSIFECVRSCAYLSDLEKDVIVELNKCRTNPARYADEVLVPYLERMGDDGIYVDSQGLNIMTQEGRSAVQEAIDALKIQEPLPMLLPNLDLSSAAADHCADQGPKGLTGCDSSDGTPFYKRIQQYDLNFICTSENIDYGSSTGKEIIRSLIVDDGAPSRGHRENTFGKFNYVGVSFGTHKKYRYMCVLDFGKR